MKYLKLLLIKTIQNKNSLYFFILSPNDKYSTLSEGEKSCLSCQNIVSLRPERTKSEELIIKNNVYFKKRNQACNGTNATGYEGPRKENHYAYGL